MLCDDDDDDDDDGCGSSCGVATLFTAAAFHGTISIQ